MSTLVTTFYKFTPLDDYRQLQAPLQALCEAEALKGTILLAPEGINATLAGHRAAIDQVLKTLRLDPRLADLETRESFASEPPFGQMKVKLRREIVSFGQPTVDPSQRTGTAVPPQQWNQLISDPAVTVIDTRNDFEVAVGSFKGAQNPKTASFQDFVEYARQLDPVQHKQIAMFCTGGIRCEKASAYLLSQGFDTVYQLQGGILNYLAEVPESDSLWQGECFVFDQRVAVGHRLEPGSYQLCRDCGQPVPISAPICPHCAAAVEQSRDRSSNAP
ncbi:rhodanese-related sulfurtransferase [Romeria aff. gracilis LEGE 07310]|uniref:tRNA uridine(34) hydroxylase n=1 Tax=Vasconcelosia minhoensis LEGE 07310 TaxID=915328 RepID=A0A8J7AVW0_9CYAN|nr:rhodanese-related sulfurtransferase [Romeria gracilis]MBE9076662.1 rhodanese-related sulfurtransferase [Romeria aff. gracilis LEGE 07310]